MVPHVRICGGDAQQWVSLLRPSQDWSRQSDLTQRPADYEGNPSISRRPYCRKWWSKVNTRLTRRESRTASLSV